MYFLRNELLAVLAVCSVLQQVSAAVNVLFEYKNQAGKLDAAAFDDVAGFDVDIDEYNIADIEVDEADVEEVLEKLNADPDIVIAERDQLYFALPHGPTGTPDESRELSGEAFPYGVRMVQADQLWGIPEVNPDLTICVVDTGMDLGHEDLPTTQEGVIGTDRYTSGNWNIDGSGHGTHVAGTIGAIGENGVGVIGVQKDPDTFFFHIGKGLNDEGKGLTGPIMSTIRDCVKQGAKIVSLSLGGGRPSPIAERFYRKIYDEGVLVIAAAGNDGRNGPSHMYPASYDAVMSVAAVNSNGNRPSFSQCNTQVEITAPGVDVLSTVPGSRYGIKSGTSMACPHVAAVAAQVWSRFPNCTNNQIRNVLFKTAKSVDGADGRCTIAHGAGLVQARAAYDLLKKEGCNAGGDSTSRTKVGGCAQHGRTSNEWDGCSSGSLISHALSFVVSALCTLVGSIIW